jgi:NCS1 family nucleobase:cation symporter-1
MTDGRVSLDRLWRFFVGRYVDLSTYPLRSDRDLIPIPPERRTYKIWSFAVYWSVSGACESAGSPRSVPCVCADARRDGLKGISAYSTGSSLLAYGLNAQQAMACVVIGGVITGLLSVASGWVGEVHQ